MKGPFHRLRYDLSRVWECQICHHKLSTDGVVTSQMCDCRLEETGKWIAMRLVADGPRRQQFVFEKASGKSNASTANLDQSEPDKQPT